MMIVEKWDWKSKRKMGLEKYGLEIQQFEDKCNDKYKIEYKKYITSN